MVKNEEGNASFINNRAVMGNGGALYADISSSVEVLNGHIDFLENGATEGSGGAVFLEHSTLNLEQGTATFANNWAMTKYGGGLYASLSSVVALKGNMYFSNNSANGGSGGAVFLGRSTLLTGQDSSFVNNWARSQGGGVYALLSDVQCSGHLLFESNEAHSGGAMVFDGNNSTLSLLAPVAVDFTDNKAKLGGGAIFFLDSNSITQCEDDVKETNDCFFRLQNSIKDIKLNFNENDAGRGGTALYGGALDQCEVDLDGMEIDGFTIFNNISTITRLNNSNASDITSDPRTVCFCINGSQDCSLESLMVNVSRGKTFPLPIVAVGQGDMPVPSTIRAYFDISDQDKTVTLTSYKSESQCRDITLSMLSNKTSEMLVLYADGPCNLISTASKTIEIHFEHCPDGFDLSDSGYECVCEERLLKLNETNKCNIDDASIELPKGAWIEPTWNDNGSYSGFIFSHHCPLDYCNESINSLVFSPDGDAQCRDNRRGILCGMCVSNHSLTLNQFHCKICGNEYISLLLFFALAGVLLIVVLVGLHMTVAAGTINGLILYANVIGANMDIFFPFQGFSFLKVFISWINLDFGIESCFYDGLDFYTYAWLQYAFPLYLWFLMGLIIITSRRSDIVMRLIGSNPIAVLATLLLMSYVKILQAIITSMSFEQLEFPDGVKRAVWMYDGNVNYFEGKHIYLASFSSAISAFIFLPFTFFILFGYIFLAFSNKRGLTWLNKFKPLLDAYYGPYQKQTRYWTGFMLLVRFSLYLTFAGVVRESIKLLAILTVFSLVIAIPWLGRGGVYESLYLNLLEASFVINICLLTIVTYHTGGEMQEYVTSVFVGIAFAEFVGIVAFHIFLHITVLNILKKNCSKK